MQRALEKYRTQNSLFKKKEKKNKSFESSQQKKPHKKKSFDKKNEVKLNLSSDKPQFFSFHLVFGQK